MPRKPSKANEASVRLLRDFVKKKALLPCNSFADIQQLQFKIRQSTNEYLSLQTLNRFFGLIKTDFKPATATLNILARYVNYNSFAEFELLQNASVTTGSQGTVSSELLITLFSQVEFDATNAKGRLCISRNIYRLLERDPGLAKDIYPFMASQEFGRRYFFEQFVYIDALNHHYGDGLIYYPMYTDDREQLFFAYSVLCLRAFLNCQRTHFDFYFDKISDYTLTEIRAFPPALLGRYYAVEVLNCAVNHCDINLVCEALALFQHQRQSGKDSGAVTFAHFILGTALVLAGDYEQARTLLHEEFEHVKNAQDNKREQYVTQYKLLRLYAGYSPQSRRRPPHPLPQKHPKPKRRCAPGGKGNAARLLKRRIHAAQPLNVA